MLHNELEVSQGYLRPNPQKSSLRLKVRWEAVGSWLEAVVQTLATLMKSLIPTLSMHVFQICSMPCRGQLLVLTMPCLNRNDLEMLFLGSRQPQ